MITNKKYISLLYLMFLFFSPVLVSGQNDNFHAYYTRLSDDYPPLIQYQDSLFGRYADIVVQVGTSGQLIFSRETSYLPQWKTKKGLWTFNEIIERKGDGDKKRPDVVSRYSHVRIIEQSSDQIIIHWRYFPDFNKVAWGDVVEEYFFIKPDGNMLRTIKKGTAKIDDWNNNTGLIHQKIILNEPGINYLDTVTKPKAPTSPQLSGKPNVSESNKNLMLQFKFDKIRENSTIETVSRQVIDIKGPKTLFKKGISSNALNLDGYYSGIVVEDFSSEGLQSGFTIEAWIALGAYPFDWAPIIQQSEWGKNGFYLGIDQNGYPGFHMTCGNQWISVVDSSRLDLYKWYHISVSYNENSSEIHLFLNGHLVGSAETGGLKPNFSDTPLWIGLNRQKMPPVDGRIRRGKWPSLFGIDGLIDEVEISKRAHTSSEITEKIETLNIAEKQLKSPDLEKRYLPDPSSSGLVDDFNAYYTRISYYETWDNLWRVGEYPDIIVSFDNSPTQIVFWRGTSFGPFFVTENGKWIGDQSNEDYRLLEYPGEAEGCLEHMSDKQCRYSHVRIIENTPARKVIHWRYGLVDSRYLFAPWNGGWGGWTDEYWTIYPDGVAIRNVTRGIVFGDGWVETMFLSAPGTLPEDNCELQAYTVLDSGGKIHKFSWENDAPEGVVDDAMLTMVNSKSEYRMFNVYPDDSFIEIFGGHSRRSKFHWWNHWPVSQITSDGRGARAADRVAHSSLAHGAPGTHYLLYGISNKSIDELQPFARSWRNPPEISVLDGISKVTYQQEERAWHLTSSAEKISFSIAASAIQPVYNPVFILKNRSQNIKSIVINDRILSENSYRAGFQRSASGLHTILWIEYQSKEPVQVEMIFN